MVTTAWSSRAQALKSLAWRQVLKSLVLVLERWADLWGSLVSQLSLPGDFQVPGRDSVSKTKVGGQSAEVIQQLIALNALQRTWIYYVTRDDFELTILLPLPLSKCWGYRCVLQDRVTFSVSTTENIFRYHQMCPGNKTSTCEEIPV